MRTTYDLLSRDVLEIIGVRMEWRATSTLHELITAMDEIV